MVCALMLMACSSRVSAPQPSDMRLSPVSASLVAGDSVYMRLSNDGDVDVRYTACGSTLQRQSGSAWVDATTRGNCGDVGWPLLKSHTSTIVLLLLWTPDLGIPSDLPPGTYRAVLGGAIATDGHPVPAVSEPFAIVGVEGIAAME
jgi:hypothetical protein